MNPRLILKILGGFWILLSSILLIPGSYAAIEDGSVLNSFLVPAIVFTTLGLILWLCFKKNQSDLNIKTTFALVVLCWLSACIIGALPYYLSTTFNSFIDCLFESSSGFTGTGATVLSNIESTASPILLWRSLTQWLGGIGIIIFFIALLPLLGVGGVQLFKAEVTGPDQGRFTPRIKDTARILWLIYISLTAIVLITFKLLGMSWFDAINHALTTAATGGFSTKSSGIAAFNNPAIEYAIALFILISSTSFAIHFQIITGRLSKNTFTTEIKYYFLIIFSFTFIIFLSNYLTSYNWEEAFRSGFFTVAATASSTGYTNYDYLQFPVFVHFLLLLLMLMGGMSGSTAGGIKCVRLVAAFKFLRKELKQALHPHASLAVKVNKRVLSDKIAGAIWGFLFLYLFILSIMSLILCLEGQDLVSSVSASISALSNIGPAYGEFGPYSNYTSLTDYSKLTFCLGMLLGRLEFFAVLVIFTKDFWKKY